MNPFSSAFCASALCLFSAVAASPGRSAQPQTSGVTTQATAVAPRPNIIFVLCDDLGYGDLSCFGQKNFSTPNLDRMAKEGTRLTHHYASSPVCVPTRASLMLGLHTGHSPVRDHQFDRAIPDSPTMASVLRQAGYRTLHVGKWGIGGKPAEGFPAHPQKRGFDAFYGLMTHGAGHVHYPDAEHTLFDGYRDATAEVSDTYSTDLYTAKAKQWITEQVKERPKQPFFMYLAYIAPHSDFQVPDAPYPNGKGINGGLHMPLKTNPTNKDKWIDPEFTNATYDDDGDVKTPKVPWTDLMKRYATMVRRLDEANADLLQTLRDLKIDKNTLVVFTSDNGPAFDKTLRASQLQSWGPLDGFKRDLAEGGIREPTIVWWPGTVKADAVSARPSVQYDWLTTFAELAGTAAPARTDGVSLAPQLTGRGTQKSHEYLYWEFHGPSNRVEDRDVLTRKKYPLPVPDGQGAAKDPWGQQQAIRIGDYVGLRAQIKDADSPLRLYNVVRDPHQDADLAGRPEHAALIAQMKRLLQSAHQPQPGNPRPYDNIK
ncbi:MAG: sulfatase-like hydrolase/transferase [Armatimonadota bacterium]